MIDWAAIEAKNAQLLAFVDLDRAATFGEGPLDDLAIGIKSNIAVRGLPWTAGMALRRDVIADRDAEVVARLRAAGAAILGTVNMHEAALGATTDNPWFGRTINPHRDGYTPGGSSGGSGAAVAAGLCDAALGTDTLGSVRIPASYNGVYGLKPTNGAVDDDGLVPLGRAFDCIGPLARSLDVLERVWRVMAPDAPGSDAAPFARLLFLADHGDVSVQPDVAAACERAMAATGLARTGFALADNATDIRMAALALVGRELAADLGTDRTERADLISQGLHFILGVAENAPLAPEVLARTRATIRDALGDDGVLVMPVAPQTAFPQGPRAPASQADFTSLANIAGLPALALPAGLDADRLPIGIQLVGPEGSEARLFALARALDAQLCGYTPPPR